MIGRSKSPTTVIVAALAATRCTTELLLCDSTNEVEFTSLGSLPGGTGFEALVHLGIKKIKKSFYGRSLIFARLRKCVLGLIHRG